MFQESGNYDNIQFRVFRFTSLKNKIKYNADKKLCFIIRNLLGYIKIRHPISFERIFTFDLSVDKAF